MEGGPPIFGQGFSCPALLEDASVYPYGAVTRYGPPFQTVPVLTHATGLVRVRSPLLAESRLMSFPPATEMFQFAGFASAHLWIQPADTPTRVGCPIRRSWDQRSLAPPPSLSQRATSFIASWRQGIHQIALLAPATTPPPAPKPRLGRQRTPAGLSQRLHRQDGAAAPPTPEQPSSALHPLMPARVAPLQREDALPMPNARKRLASGRREEEGQGPRLPNSPHHHVSRTMSSRPPPRIARAARRAPLLSCPRCPMAQDGASAKSPGGLPEWARARFERPTSRLSGVRSNQLSYGPEGPADVGVR